LIISFVLNQIFNQESAIRRLDVGGKMLTNLLKEAVTYRQWNMMDEYHIVNDAKEQVRFSIV
jgi:actin-related protein 6